MKEGAHLRLVDMIIITLIRASNNHDDKVLAMVRTEVVHGRLQQVLVLLDPLGEVER